MAGVQRYDRHVSRSQYVDATVPSTFVFLSTYSSSWTEHSIKFKREFQFQISNYYKMSQELSKRGHDQRQEPVKFADVFPALHGELADKAVAPGTPPWCRRRKSTSLGWTSDVALPPLCSPPPRRIKGLVMCGPMTWSNIVQDDVTITETDLPGRRIFTESVRGQVSSL